MDVQKIDRQAQEMIQHVSEFKKLLIKDIPQHLKIKGKTYSIGDLSEEEQNYYNIFVRENFNKIILNYEDSVNTILENLQSNDIKIKKDEIYNSYYFFKWKKKNLVYYLEKISYTIDVTIYKKPMKYEYYDRYYEEWYPSDYPEEILQDLSSCTNNPLFENISIKVKEIAWYGLIEHLVQLYWQASCGYTMGSSMVYGSQ